MSPKILIEIYQQHNQSLPEVKALTSERLKKCRSRINQAVRDGCLEQYLEDFTAAVKKAQQTPFLRGEGARGWRAGFDWFVANHVNVYGVLEGKYDTAFAKAQAGSWPHIASAQADRPAEALAKAEGGNDNASFDGGGRSWGMAADHRENEPGRSDLHPPPVNRSVRCAAGRDGGARTAKTCGIAGASASRRACLPSDWRCSRCSKCFFAIGQHNAIGFSPFGIDRTGGPGGDSILRVALYRYRRCWSPPYMVLLK